MKLVLDVLRPKQDLEEVMEEGEGGSEERDSASASEEGEESGVEGEGSEDEGEESSSGEEGEEGAEGVDPAFAEEVRRALGAAAAVGSDGEVRGCGYAVLDSTPFPTPFPCGRVRSLWTMRP